MTKVLSLVSPKIEKFILFRVNSYHIQTKMAKKYEFHIKNQKSYQPGSRDCNFLKEIGQVAWALLGQRPHHLASMLECMQNHSVRKWKYILRDAFKKKKLQYIQQTSPLNGFIFYWNTRYTEQYLQITFLSKVLYLQIVTFIT